MTDLPKEETGSVEARWAWAVAIGVNIIAIIMFERESFMGALGNTMASVTLGLLLSPVMWLISRPLIKVKWRWYHWFNVAAFTAVVLKILYWALVPLAQSMLGGA